MQSEPFFADNNEMNRKILFIILIMFPLFNACGNSHFRNGNTISRKNTVNAGIISHTIVRGDTVYSLSRRYQVSVNSIMQKNNIHDPSELRIGRIIFIPQENTPSAGIRQNIPVIQNGESITFIYPVKGKILSRYGYRKRSRRSRRYSFHNGIDIKGKIGTPILASASGIVFFSGRKRGYGKVVKIKHSGGFMTVYGHNRINLVRKGQHVTAGQVIAQIGLTGRTTGSHLHFEIRLKNKTVNPEHYLNRTLDLNSRQ